LKPVDAIIEQNRAIRTIERGRLFRKYFLLILALVCGALLISGAIGLYFSYQENKLALASLQREKAVSAAARIEQFIRQIEQQLSFASLPQLGAEGIEQRRIEFLKLQRLVPAITDTAQIDASGREQLAVSRLAMDVVGADKNRSQDPAFKGAKPKETWFGPVSFRKETEPYMSIAVRSSEGGPVTVADVNLKFIWDVVTRIKIGKKGKAYVVDGSGHLVADPDIGLVLRKTDLSKLTQVKFALEKGAEDSLALVAQDPSGGAVLTAYGSIDPLGWKVFVEQPVSEVYETLNATIIRTVSLIVAGLLISALAAMWLARSMVRPIRTLQDGAARIGAGNLDQRIEVKTGDELEALAEQFNQMTVQLRESYAGLERKVAVRTAELNETLEQQTAISEILRVISNSPGDVRPMLDAVAERAVKLCDSGESGIFLLEGERLRFAAGCQSGETFKEGETMAVSRGSVLGRAVIDRTPVHVADLSLAPVEEFPSGREYQQRFGHRSIVAVPLMREDRAIGVIGLWRFDVRVFSEKHIALVRTFADQAAIAIENVRLFNETKEALEQQTATSEILRVISGSPTDVQPVFEAIAKSGLHLFEDANVWVVLRDGNAIRAAAISEREPERIAKWKAAFPTPLTRDYLNATAILDNAIVDIPDVDTLARPLKPGTANFAATGYKAVTITPMMRGESAIGAIGVARLKPGPLNDKQIALLKTFADQAVIAIENVRLFNETREALEQQKASAEVLGAISSSIADTKPVFDKILESCERLFEGHLVGVTLATGDGKIDLVAYHGADYEKLKAVYPLPLTHESGSGSAILDAAVKHYPDSEAPGTPSGVRDGCRVSGMRSLLFAPMLYEGSGIGAIWVGRSSVSQFTDKQIALLKTFADQAVIAIQNAKLFREIQEKSRQLEIANQHKSDFLANMSHELRTPLNAIIGFSEVLMEKMFGELNEKQADYMKDIHESGRHLLSLINDILDLSKIEAGRMELEPSDFDLPSALSNAMTLVRERAQRHGIALGLNIDPNLSTIRADERKFKQIVVNLLSNAVKFTSDGGRVDVSAKLDNDKVEIAVADTGIGIAPEDQAAVFEEFKQVGRDYTRKAEGTGLGLALTKRFVELHGGAIRLASEPGKGSTFTFTIPLGL
jgi:signal transduction histidine kinase